MRFLSTQIKALSQVMLLFVFIWSSGLNVAFELCCDSEWQVAGLASPANSRAQDCDVALARLILRTDENCHTRVVVGGLNQSSALLEKTLKEQISGRGMSVDIVPLNSLSSRFNSFANNSRSLVAANHPPPRAEKYVLNSSFLI